MKDHFITDSNCIFCKIVAGEIPSHKVYEDEKFFAFLEINPIHLGHTLLVPKDHVDYILDATDDIYTEIWLKAKEIAPKIQSATGAKRIGFEVEGFGVPHLHIHLIPLFEPNEIDPHNQKSAKPEDLARMAEKIRANF